MQRVLVLGATGSIGCSTLDVISKHPERYSVFALTAHKNLQKLIAQAKTCQPRFLICANETDFPQLKTLAEEARLDCEVLAGKQALIDIAKHEDVDIVMAAIVGAAGLAPTYAAVCAGKKVLLANKEALVMSGQIFIDAVQKHGAELLPVDSEHNAIFQCLPESANKGGVDKILLTGSGGPFLKRDLSTFSTISPDEACNHPNWSMGRKISVDSATMMNKGLEYIEAKWLFAHYCDEIEIIIHPQSIVHSMVQYSDGSVLAQMGNPDMRTPIAHTLAYPERIVSGVDHLNFAAMRNLEFGAPDFSRFPGLKIAIDCAAEGQEASTVLNAANELAVAAFLDREIRFDQIASVCENTLNNVAFKQLNTIEDVIDLDNLARISAKQIIEEASRC